MVTNTAKLQEKVMALTNIDGKGGINILTEYGDFKSTYEILLGISKVWKEMDDTSQAALLELIAGKTRGSVVAALFQNGDVLEDAYSSAIGASGSAVSELNTYLDSIQGRIDLFTNSVQTMWMNLLDADVIKTIVDIGTTLIKFIDSGIGRITALGAALGLIGKFLKIPPAITAVNGQLQILGKTTKAISADFAQLSAQSTGFFGKFKAGLDAIFVPSELTGSKIDLSSILSEDAFNTELSKYITGFNNLDQSVQAVSWDDYVKGVSASDKAMGAALDTCTMQNGAIVAGENAYQAYAGAATSAAVGNQVVGESAKRTTGQLIGMKVAALATKAALTLGLSVLISLAMQGITAMMNAGEAARDAAKEATSAAEKLKEQNDSLEDYKEQIIELRKELDSNNLSEQEAYDVREKLLTIQDELIEKFGLEKDGINLVTGAINGQIKAIDVLQKKSAQQWLNTNQDSINDALKFFENDKQGDKLDGWWERFFSVNGIDNWGATQNVVDMLQQYGDEHENINVVGGTGSLDIKFYGPIEDVKETIDDFNVWLDKKEGELIQTKNDLLSLPDQTKDVKKQITSLEKDIAQLQDVREDLSVEYRNWFGEDSLYAANKAVIEQTQYQTAIAKYTDQYMRILEAENNLMDAQARGDKEGVVSALETLNAETEAASEIARKNGQQYMVDFFYGIKDEYSRLSGELKLEKDLISNAVFGNEGKHLKDTILNILSELNGMNAEEILQFNKIDLNNSSLLELIKIANDYHLSIDELINALVNLGYVQSGFDDDVDNIVKTADTYSTIAESVEKFNEIQKQTNEVLHDGVEISEDYYESLKEQLADVTVGEEDFSDAVDTSNGYIVKNASLLKKLVAQSKNIQKETIRTAKAQAQLEYKEIVQQISNNIVAMANEYKAYGLITDATFDNISAMNKQLEILEQTVQQYALLEIGLSDAANAYTEYEAAKERDAQLTYDDSLLEMLKTIDEGILKNETGTEAFEYAVKAVVPEEFWKDIDDVDEKIKAIHDYIDGNPVFSRLFYVDEESGELDVNADNVREFVDMGLQKNESGISVFEGSSTDFTLSDNIEGIKDVAEFYGITEAATLAMLTALEKVDAKWGDILAEVMMTPFDRKVNSAVREIADLNTQLADGSISVEEYTEKINEANVNLATYTKEAKNKLLGSDNGTKDTSDDTIGYIEATKKVTEAQEDVAESAEKLAKAQAEYDEVFNSGARGGDLEPYADAVHTATSELNNHVEALAKVIEERDKLGKYPSEYEISLVISDIDKVIEAEGSKFTKAIEENFHLDNNGYYIINTGLNMKDLEDKYPGIQEFIKLCNTKTEIQAFVDTTSAEESANQLKKTVDDVIAAIEENLITLDLDEDAVNNIVTQANKILSGIGSNLSIDLDYTTPWGNNIDLGSVSFDVNSASSSSSTNSTPKSNANVRQNGAYALGNANENNVGLKSAEYNSVVGELGPEMVVDPIKGIYYTVGNNGTEMVNLPKGAIIYNHKQTEELLKSGYTTRGNYTGGLSFASGNAHGGFGIPSHHPNLKLETSFDNGTKVNNDWDDAEDTLSGAAQAAADAANEFAESLDWIEVRMEEFEEKLSKLNAELENQTTYIAKNAKIDEIIAVNRKKLADSKTGADYYEDYAQKYYSQIPGQYQEMAKNGEIAITDFAGEASEATVEAIQKYREYIQKAADLNQQAEEIITEIRDLVIQKIDNIQEYGSAKTGIEDSQIEKIQNAIDLIEESGNIASAVYYTDENAGMMENARKKIEYWQPLLKDMQTELDEAVKNGTITVGSIEWYEQLEKLYEVQAAIDEATIELEEFQNAVNQIYWDNFDELINRLDYLKEETESLIDLIDSADMVSAPKDKDFWGADDVEWTKEGITTLGLYAQEMQRAEYAAQKYADAIDDLTTEYKAGHYSESEYQEKLAELKKAQYDELEAIQDAKDGIVKLNEARVDAIKDGIQKEIEAYEELIDKKKEELDAEKDLYDFQKSVAEQQKDIADIQRKLAALSGDNSSSAVAQRKKLEAELAEAKAALEESYYERSIDNRQNALDKELEDFQTEKETEIEMWEQYLENVEQVVADSLANVTANYGIVYDTLNAKAEEYDLTLSDAIISPWQDGITAIGEYTTAFGDSTGSTLEQLKEIEEAWQAIIDKQVAADNKAMGDIDAANDRYAAATKKPEPTPSKPTTDSKPSTQEKAITVGGKINASGAKIYSYAGDKNGLSQYFASDPIYTVLQEKDGYLLVRHHKSSSGVTGWFKKSDVKAYAKGTTGVDKDQWAVLDELGDELTMHADGSGRLAFLSKGSAVIPHDISENLMQLGSLDPSEVLSRSAPQIGVHPEIHNTEINLNITYGDMVSIGEFHGDNLADLEKIVAKQFEQHTKNINQALRKYTR